MLYKRAAERLIGSRRAVGKSAVRRHVSLGSRDLHLLFWCGRYTFLSRFISCHPRGLAGNYSARAQFEPLLTFSLGITHRDFLPRRCQAEMSSVSKTGGGSVLPLWSFVPWVTLYIYSDTLFFFFFKHERAGRASVPCARTPNRGAQLLMDSCWDQTCNLLVSAQPKQQLCHPASCR